MAKGWISLEREITDHWIWHKEPFTKAQAWMDLLLHANHKPTQILIKGNVIKLGRGDQARSELTLADEWKWSRGKVRRFLKLLQTEHMIVQKTTQHTSLISICNYSKYQDQSKQGGTTPSTPDDTTPGTTPGHQAVQHPDSTRYTVNNVNNENNANNGNQKPSESADADPPPQAPPAGDKSRFKSSDDQFKLADRMANPVRNRFPNQKINVDEWADAVRKLNELDNHSLADITALWAWIVRHETDKFSWADNCRTPMKLREKKDGLPYFDVIWKQMIRDQQGKAPSQKEREAEEWANGGSVLNFSGEIIEGEVVNG